MRAKDFEQVAEAIKDASAALPESDQKTRIMVAMAKSIATVLARQNPRFDRQRFLIACGFSA